MNDEKPKECYFCHTPKFIYWMGSHGLRGLRCQNRCIGSYVIFTEPSVTSGFPPETETEKKERIRDEERNKKRKKR